MEVNHQSHDREKRSQWLHVRLSPKELQKLQERCKKTTSRDMSNYVRKVLLGKPVTVFTRDQSLDDFVKEMILLKNELSAIGSNINQQARRLNSHVDNPSLKVVIAAYLLLKEQLDGKVNQIRDSFNQVADQWLQESSAEKASKEQ